MKNKITELTQSEKEIIYGRIVSLLQEAMALCKQRRKYSISYISWQTIGYYLFSITVDTTHGNISFTESMLSVGFYNPHGGDSSPRVFEYKFFKNK